jgi:hypothetical protein
VSFAPRIEAHDASRIEWSVYVPLTARDGDAEVELALEVPENIHAPHDGWERLQILARLSTPDEEPLPAQASSVDEVRRAALGTVRRLKLLREALPRAGAVRARDPLPVAPTLLRELQRIVDQVVQAQTRERYVAQVGSEPSDVARERALADEFLSGQLLELLTVAEESCARLCTLSVPELPASREAALGLRRRVEELLSAELRERARRGYPLPEEGDALALSAFLERAALLKKHFQEVLFLEPEVAMIDQQARNLVALCGAATAFLFYFSLQALQSSAAARAGLSVGTAVALGAFAYALKDRMKELTRQWLSGKLSHLYANRLLTLRAPSRLHAARPVVLQARESFTQTREPRPDVLNPAAGATVRTVVVRYRQRIKVKRCAGALSAFSRVKLVCRYDLSPLLTRTDDSVKRVPVAGSRRGEVRFADAPRLYRLEVRLRVRTDAGETSRRAAVLLRRSGICGIAPLPELPEGELAGGAAEAANDAWVDAAAAATFLPGLVDPVP